MQLPAELEMEGSESSLPEYPPGVDEDEYIPSRFSDSFSVKPQIPPPDQDDDENDNNAESEVRKSQEDFEDVEENIPCVNRATEVVSHPEENTDDISHFGGDCEAQDSEDPSAPLLISSKTDSPEKLPLLSSPPKVCPSDENDADLDASYDYEPPESITTPQNMSSQPPQHCDQATDIKSSHLNYLLPQLSGIRHAEYPPLMHLENIPGLDKLPLNCPLEALVAPPPPPPPPDPADQLKTQIHHFDDYYYPHPDRIVRGSYQIPPPEYMGGVSSTDFTVPPPHVTNGIFGPFLPHQMPEHQGPGKALPEDSK